VVKPVVVSRMNGLAQDGAALVRPVGGDRTAAALVSAVVVNFNAGRLLAETVRSVLASTVSVEVIVADNGSTDGSIDSLRELVGENPRLKIVENGANLGFSRANNLALRYARGDYLLFLNPDCLIYPDTLREVLSVIGTRSDVGMAGCLIRNPDGTEQAGCRRSIPTLWRSVVRAFGLYRFAGKWPRLFYDFHLHKQPLPDCPIEVEVVSGACMLVRREAIEDVGLWDEGYFLHCEDLDWCLRFRQKGWKILFVPDARVVHEQGACSRSRPIFVEWHKHRGMVRFYRKFFRKRYPGVLMWVVVFGVWLRFGAVVGYYGLRALAGRGKAERGGG
jgi:GT2 family glycosyltransferase